MGERRLTTVERDGDCLFDGGREAHVGWGGLQVAPCLLSLRAQLAGELTLGSLVLDGGLDELLLGVDGTDALEDEGGVPHLVTTGPVRFISLDQCRHVRLERRRRPPGLDDSLEPVVVAEPDGVDVGVDLDDESFDLRKRDLSGHHFGDDGLQLGHIGPHGRRRREGGIASDQCGTGRELVLKGNGGVQQLVQR